MAQPERIAVLTSGGDAPGMNAAVRAVTRVGIEHGVEVVGVRHGFKGLVHGDFIPLDRRAVGGIVQLAGTVLGSSRYPQFATQEAQQRGIEHLERLNIGALVVIGGNGSQKGAAAFDSVGLSTVGVASTIDNDLPGSEPSIGFETAVMTAVEAVDRLRATATSHRRIFVIEVMGRHFGAIAAHAALAGGAEACLVPETIPDLDDICDHVLRTFVLKGHAIVVVAEGCACKATDLRNALIERRSAHGLDDVNVRVTILGHVQRGAAPTVGDRILASRLGEGAVMALVAGEHGVLVGQRDGAVRTTPLMEVNASTKSPDAALLRLATILER